MSIDDYYKRNSISSKPLSTTIGNSLTSIQQFDGTSSISLTYDIPQTDDGVYITTSVVDVSTPECSVPVTEEPKYKRHKVNVYQPKGK